MHITVKAVREIGQLVAKHVICNWPRPSYDFYRMYCYIYDIIFYLIIRDMFIGKCDIRVIHSTDSENFESSRLLIFLIDK